MNYLNKVFECICGVGAILFLFALCGIAGAIERGLM